MLVPILIFVITLILIVLYSISATHSTRQHMRRTVLLKEQLDNANIIAKKLNKVHCQIPPEEIVGQLSVLERQVKWLDAIS